MNTDQAVSALWDICDDGWWMRATSDQWWRVRVECPHGEWVADSNGAIDIASAFERVVAKAATGHGQNSPK